MNMECLSTGSTFYLRIFVPAFALMVAAMLVANWAHSSATERGMSIVMVAVLAWQGLRVVGLKEVFLSGDQLVVSNFLSQQAILLADIQSVSGDRWGRLKLVTLRFKCQTRFGRVVRFAVSSGGWFLDYDLPPVVLRLRKLVEAATTGAATEST